MPLSDVVEPKVLDNIYGNVVAQCNSTIAAGATAQTSITLRGSAGSGNADHTPVSGEVWAFATPGAAGSENQMSNWDIYVATGGTATSITFTSRTAVAARAVGDVAFVLTTTTGMSQFGNVMLNQKLFAGLSSAGATATVSSSSDLAALPQGTLNITQTSGTFPASGNIIVVSESGEQNIAYTGLTGSNPSVTALTGCTGGTGTVDTGDTVYLVPTAATILANEPTSTGAYARVAMINNAANFSAATGTRPASKTNAAAIAFPTSTGSGYSTGATKLPIIFFADNSTLGGGNIVAWSVVTVAYQQAINAAGITPQVAASTYTHTLL